MASPAPTPDGATCWICLEEGPDDAGQPLMRGCACRGDAAGFAHVTCLAGYASRKSDDIHEKSPMLSNCSEPWVKCQVCKQPYTGEVKLELHRARVMHVQGQNLQETDTRYLYMLLESGNPSIDDMDALRRLLEITRANPDIPGCGQYVLEGLFRKGVLHAKRSENEQCIECYRDALEVARRIGHQNYITELERLLQVHEKYMTGDSVAASKERIEGLLQALKSYEGTYGKNSLAVFNTVERLVRAFRDEGRWGEALSLIYERLDGAKSTLGHDHPTTKKLEQLREEIESDEKTVEEFRSMTKSLCEEGKVGEALI